MNNSKFIKITLSLTLILIIVTASLQIIIDPLFQYHKPWFNMKPYISNERYQNAGIAKNFEFENVIIGNSLSENFKVSDVSKAFGGETVKLTASGSHTLDWTFILKNLSERKNAPKHILINLDPYIFQASYTELKHNLPEYLYDNNYLNDVNYLLNFAVIKDFTYPSIRENKNNTVPDYDSFMLWNNNFEYGKKFVLDHYKRPNIKLNKPDNTEYLKTVSCNLELITPYIDKMNKTEFVFFFSPFSMLYWDMQMRENEIKKQKSAYIQACQILSEYDNVTLYLWTNERIFKIMANLDYYVDEAHYSPEVCEIMAELISEKSGMLTKEKYRNEIDKLFNYIENFNYDSLFD